MHKRAGGKKQAHEVGGGSPDLLVTDKGLRPAVRWSIGDAEHGSPELRCVGVKRQNLVEDARGRSRGSEPIAAARTAARVRLRELARRTESDTNGPFDDDRRK